MWTIKYGRHWVYLKYKEIKFETRFMIVAMIVYLWFQCRYSMSVYPVKYLKMYKSEPIVKLKTYSVSRVGDYEKLKRKRRR